MLPFPRDGHRVAWHILPIMTFWDVSFSPAPPEASTPPPQTAAQPSQSLNDEVTEVIGQLERFWGGFRKQVRPLTPALTFSVLVYLHLQRAKALSRLRAKTWETMSRRRRKASTSNS